ncbi:MAG: vancomycin resistance protein VanW [Myxococcota bacterium]|jgi:vancomycin resistance protein VanW
MRELTLPPDATLPSRRLGAPLTRALRNLLPVEVRIAARRAPAVARHYLGRSPALPRVSRRWQHVQCARSSPLRRPGTLYAADLQAAKEANVRRAAELLHGTVLGPGAEFSWHAQVGPPLRHRGFRAGPELHEGQLARGVGGGACQVANLVFWLALHAGLDVIERHRHDLDLFPDSQRSVPFGCGATVFHPNRDLRFANPRPQAARIHLVVQDGRLRGEIQLEAPPRHQWRIVETWHRFVLRDGEVWRENRLDRVRTDRPEEPHLIAVNRARVAYSVPAAALTPLSPEER